MMLCLCLKQSAQSDRVVICNSKPFMKKLKTFLAQPLCAKLSRVWLPAHSEQTAPGRQTAKQLREKTKNLQSRLSFGFVSDGRMIKVIMKYM